MPAGEQLMRAPARPIRGQQLGREIRVEERKLPPRMDEQRLHAEERLARRWPDRSEVLDERLVLRTHLVEIPCRGGHFRTLAEHPERTDERRGKGRRGRTNSRL